MRKPHIGEFSWKIFWVSTIWAALLFPGFLIGPIRVYFGKLPVLLDPSYLLVVLGGILFGVWGGILSPILAGAAAFAWHRELPLWVFLVAVPLQVLNGTVLPLVRSRFLPGARRLRLRPLSAYLFWALLAMPLLNGAYYAFFGRFYFWGVAPDSAWVSLGVHGLYYALLVIFPGEFLFRVASREAKDLGLFLEDRWSSWSPRLVYFRQRGRVVLALCLCLLPLLLMSILAWQTIAHRRTLLQQHWVLQRTSWQASLGQTLSRSLESNLILLEVSAVEVRRLRETPEQVPAFLLGVLKSHPDILQLEYIPAKAPDAAERRRGFAADEDPPAAGTGPGIRLRQGPAGAWTLVLDRAVAGAGGAENGRLWMRIRADALVETLAVHQNRFTGRSRIALRERGGALLLGNLAGLDPKPGVPAAFLTAPGNGQWFVAWYPLLKDRWDLYYLERVDLPPGMRSYLAEQALWSGSIHLCMIMVLFGVTLLARVIPLHLPTPTDAS